MLRRRKRNSQLEINMASFSDIAFLLIVFFLLTTTFIRNTGTTMTIPAGDSTDESQEKTPTIVVMRDQITFNEKQYSLPTLRQHLKAQNYPQKAADDRIVILESQDDVTYQRYFSVVAALNDAGAVMAVMTQEASE